MISKNTFKSIENVISALISKTNTEQFLQTITYELALSINNENVDCFIELFELLFSVDPLLKNIIENIFYFKLLYHTRATIKVANHFNILYTRRYAYNMNIDIFLEDDLEKFLKIDIDISLRELISNCISYESVKILEYILQNNNSSILTSQFYRNDKSLLKDVIYKGNNIILDLILTFTNISLYDIDEIDFINTHSLMIITKTALEYDLDYSNCTEHTSSLLLHFINDVELYSDIAYEYALSSVITKYDKNLIVNNRCYNIIYERVPLIHFQFSDLRTALENNCYELFEIIINNIELKQKHIRNINYTFLQIAIMNSNIKFVKIIYELKPILLTILIKNCIRYNFKNYIAYDSSKSNLIEIIEYLKSKAKLIKHLEKNIDSIFSRMFIDIKILNYEIDSNQFIMPY